jgi:hypothetical protein
MRMIEKWKVAYWKWLSFCFLLSLRKQIKLFAALYSSQFRCHRQGTWQHHVSCYCMKLTECGGGGQLHTSLWKLLNFTPLHWLLHCSWTVLPVRRPEYRCMEFVSWVTLSQKCQQYFCAVVRAVLAATRQRSDTQWNGSEIKLMSEL